MTLPSTRALATELRANKYFTGQPCKHGHYAPRYTQSGTCQDCLVANQKQHAPEKRDIPAQLEATNIRVSAENYRRVLELAWSLTRIRYQNKVKPGDVERRRGGKDAQGGLLLYTLHLHPEDGHVVRSYAATLVPAVVDVQAARTRIFGALQAQVDQRTCEPEFRP